MQVMLCISMMKGNKKQDITPLTKDCLRTQNISSIAQAWKAVMADETLTTWNQKMVAANEAIRIKSMELTKDSKTTMESYVPCAI